MSERYLIECQPTVFICEEAHPMRVPRADWREGWRADGTYGTIKGYVCRGGETHYRWEWHVWDAVKDDYAAHEFWPTKREAVRWLRGHLEDSPS